MGELLAPRKAAPQAGSGSRPRRDVPAVPIALSITDKGRTQELPGQPVNARVAVDADGALFQELFLRAFQKAQ